MENRVYIPYIQVRSKGLIVYDLPEPPYSHNRHNLAKHETYTGIVTDHAARRIKRTVDVFLQKSPPRRIFNPVVQAFHEFRLSFITLTISAHDPVPGRDGYEALKVFLQHFRRPPARRSQSEQMRSYLWKAELQERGQLHYHVTCNSFLHYGDINRVWNGIQKNRGWLEDFYKKEGRWNPNSTDVHSVYKVRDIQAYLAKYLSKTEYRDVSQSGFPCAFYAPTIGSKVWDCSNDLKVERFTCQMDARHEALIDELVSKGKAKVKKLERCHYVECDPAAALPPGDRKKWEQWKVT